MILILSLWCRNSRPIKTIDIITSALSFGHFKSCILFLSVKKGMFLLVIPLASWIWQKKWVLLHNSSLIDYHKKFFFYYRSCFMQEKAETTLLLIEQRTWQVQHASWTYFQGEITHETVCKLWFCFMYCFFCFFFWYSMSKKFLNILNTEQ